MNTRNDTETYRLETEIGLKRLFASWYDKGMYKTAYEFKTSPWVIRYLANKHN
ncbi:hypothetical protein ACFLZA_00820 [Candidatus Neomarinimicrobiota bacterium]